MIPDWLTPLATRAATVTAPELWRPPISSDRPQRPAAILVLLGDDAAHGPDVLLIQRARQLRTHGGQIAFPGGGMEPGDVDSATTALREAAEETGLDPNGVHVLTTLPEVWVPVSDNVVTPVLAYWSDPTPVFAADPLEVAAVHRVPIADLADPTRRVRARHPRGFLGPAFDLGNVFIWGFTAGLLDRLLHIAEWERPWDHSVVVDVPTHLLGDHT